MNENINYGSIEFLQNFFSELDFISFQTELYDYKLTELIFNLLSDIELYIVLNGGNLNHRNGRIKFLGVINYEEIIDYSKDDNLKELILKIREIKEYYKNSGMKTLYLIFKEFEYSLIYHKNFEE